MEKLTRRSFITAAGAASVVQATLMTGEARGNDPGAMTPKVGVASTDVSAIGRSTYLFFNAQEALFIEAACERLIPQDDLGAGAVAAGVPNYLDKQLGGAWGAGERLYRSGPWQAGTTSQGYQLPYTPAELFHACLRAIDQHLGQQNAPFHEMVSDAQDAYLKALEFGAIDLDGVPSAVFFDILWRMTVEGFFADPAYGGNRDMVAWRLIGFPGAYADYYEAIDNHGVKFEREPLSLAEDGNRHVHMLPDIPAHL
jgi:gluconate 2-dehydrogenase gamma chain